MYLLEEHLHFGNAVRELALEARLPGLVSQSAPVGLRFAVQRRRVIIYEEEVVVEITVEGSGWRLSV